MYTQKRERVRVARVGKKGKEKKALFPYLKGERKKKLIDPSVG